MKKQLFTLILLLGSFGLITAQNAPVEFGKISKAELLNKVYADDTSAAAVVLCDYGYYSDSRQRTVRTLRIKILKKEGYGWADHIFPTSSKTDIHGITYNLENDQVVKTKLSDESVFKTRISGDNYEIRIAMPNVKVGSVIDIQFGYDHIPYTWDFQQEIPVVHSELVIEPGSYIMYHKNSYGSIPLTVNTDDRWVAENVPAFKTEPYISSPENYRSHFEFDIEFIIFQKYTQDYTTSWDAVREWLNKSFYFGVVLDNDGYLKSAAADIKAKCSSREEMLRMAYAFAKQVKWNHINSVDTDKTSLGSCLKEGKGNAAEVNLVLVQLLRRLGFDAAPVVMSTRRHGRLSTLHSSINKLNYVIAAVISKDDTLLLDATETHCPYYLLPFRALNGQGQVMDKKSSGWINLQPSKKDKEMVIYTLAIDSLKMEGKLTYSRGDYAALNFRNDYEEFNSDEAYLDHFKEGRQGLKIIAHRIDNLDSLYEPVNEEFDVLINNASSNLNGELLVMPLLFDQEKENPFNTVERKYPVDFGYAWDRTIIANYTIPQGYMVSNLPSNMAIKLHGNSASFVCLSTVSGANITLKYKLNINKCVFEPAEYADLREFFGKVVTKEAEPIVLKRN